LQATLGDTVPDGMTVVLTITAPIRMPFENGRRWKTKYKTLLGRDRPVGMKKTRSRE